MWSVLEGDAAATIARLDWILDSVLKVFRGEIEARVRCGIVTVMSTSTLKPKKSPQQFSSKFYYKSSAAALISPIIYIKIIQLEYVSCPGSASAADELRTVDLVELTAYSIFDDFQVDIEAFAVDVICSKIQSYDLKVYYAYLSGLKFCRLD